MKKTIKLLSLCYFFLFIIIHSYAQEWKVIHEKPHELALESIQFIDENVGWAVSKYEVIMKTTDGGVNWVIQNVGKETLNDVYFLNELVGWAVGTNRKVLYTSDGGLTWNHKAIGSGNVDFTRVLFLDDNIGFISGGSFVHRTSDGGNTWDNVQVTTSTNRHLFFVDNSVGYIVGSNSIINKTNDGGLNWIEHPSNLLFLSVNVKDIFFIDEMLGYAIAADGPNTVILRTTDGAENWLEILEDSSFGGFNKQIQFINENIAYACNGINKLYKTLDGGLNWEEITITNDQNNVIIDMFVIDENIWLGSNFGKVQTSQDGGITWDIPFFPTFGNFMTSIFTFDNQKLWVAGSKINISENGGINFIEIDHPGEFLNSIYFINNSMGFAVGELGSLIKTTDGGNTWALTDLSTNLDFNEIVFADEINGWIIGDGGIIFKTSDGGDSWISQSSVDTRDLLDIEIIDNNELWIVGDDELLLHTQNGGNVWSEVSLENPWEYNEGHSGVRTYSSH